jgi:hypothetical protein
MLRHTRVLGNQVDVLVANQLIGPASAVLLPGTPSAVALPLPAAVAEMGNFRKTGERHSFRDTFRTDSRGSPGSLDFIIKDLPSLRCCATATH